MGRRGGMAGPKPKKRKKVTVQLIKEKHAGETTEPYKILSEIRNKEHGHLEGAKIALAWRMGWRPDANSILKLGQCRKRGDLDRELDGFDFAIMLNKEAWAGLNEKQKRALIDHELCHAQIVYDADGNPKYDDRDRLCCRIRKHDCEEFRVVVERHGLWTSDLAELARAAINDSKRPLLAEAERAANSNGAAKADAKSDAKDPGDPDTDDSWRKLSLAVAAFRSNHQDALEAAGMRTLGDLQDAMNKGGQLWATNSGVNGRFRVAVEDCFNTYLSQLKKVAAKVAKENQKAEKAAAAK